MSAEPFIRTPFGIRTELFSTNIDIQFYSPSIVRVVKSPAGFTFQKESLSVIKHPSKIKLNTFKQGDVLSLKSDKLEVAVNFKTGKITFFDRKGNQLLTEKDFGTQFVPRMDVNKHTFLVRQAFLLDKEEPIYGLGQQQNGQLNQRGQRITLKNQNTKVCIPFFQSIKGYGLFWDNYASTLFTDEEQGTSFESLGDCCDYYFLLGGNAEGVVAQLRELTGQVPLIPLWGFGYLQSKERYKTQEELVGVVEKYRALQVPLDGIIQDWQYWGPDSLWNAMRFDEKNYPDPQGMVNSIHQLKAHLMIVAWPGFGPLTDQYRELDAKKMLLHFDTWPPRSGAKPYDTYHPQARDIYWNYLNKGVFSLHTDAWWLDSSEPDHINVKESDFDQPTYLGTYRSVVNAFPLMHVRGVYEHQRATTNEQRVFILTRSAFAGQQRYGANTWSGDIVASWETLQKQIPAALNFSLTGLPYWNADIGGFFLWNYNGSNALKNNAYRELYMRWIQFGAFTPMMRSHGTDAPREIYQFGSRGDLAFDVIEKYIRLRYRLLPYLYATAWEVSRHAESFMRALVMDFPEDSQVYNLTNEYLFGRAILVAPVTESMYVSSQDGKGTEDYSTIHSKQVYLPKGADWYDFWTGEKLAGGQQVNKATPIDIMPLYIKAGAILPWGPDVQYAEEKPWDNLEIRIYPGANGTFTLYEDENDTYHYEAGAYSTITFQWNDQTRTLSISPRQGKFNGMLTSRRFNIILVNPSNGTGDDPGQPDTTIIYEGKALSVTI
jgi:alpha-D-xyloside xylohydrolase